MSSTFILMGLLVLAGFALGLLVGWLAWTSGRGDRHRSGRRAVELRPMTRGLPDWEVEHDEDAVPWRAIEHDGGDADPTVVLGPHLDGDLSKPVGPDPA